MDKDLECANVDNIVILHKCQKGRLLNTLDEYQNYRANKFNSNNVLNDKLNYSSNEIFNTIISLQQDIQLLVLAIKVNKIYT